MGEHDQTPHGRKSFAYISDLDTEAPLWLLLPKLLASLLISTGAVLLRIWFEFGELNGFAYGLAIFLAMLQILLVVGLRFQKRTDVHARKPLQKDWLDKIGAWWLVACAFGAFFGWFAGNLQPMISANLLYFQLLIVFLTIILPFVTMLPNVRYVSRNAAYIQIPILVTVTVLPMLAGVGSVFWLWTRILSR